MRLEMLRTILGSGNRPAMSKHQLIQHWPDPGIVRDISSLIGFAIFYSSFIPLFETRVSRLREITRLEPTVAVEPHFNQNARDEWEDIKQALLSGHASHDTITPSASIFAHTSLARGL